MNQQILADAAVAFYNAATRANPSLQFTTAADDLRAALGDAEALAVTPVGIGA